MSLPQRDPDPLVRAASRKAQGQRAQRAAFAAVSAAREGRHGPAIAATQVIMQAMDDQRWAYQQIEEANMIEHAAGPGWYCDA